MPKKGRGDDWLPVLEECQRCGWADPHKIVTYIAYDNQVEGEHRGEVIEYVALCLSCRFEFFKRILAGSDIELFQDREERLLIAFHGIILSPSYAEIPGWKVLKPGIIHKGVIIDKSED